MNEEKLRKEAKKNILKTKQIVNEFYMYPKAWLNKLICFRYNLSSPLTKQIRDYCSFERKNTLRKEQKIDIIVE